MRTKQILYGSESVDGFSPKLTSYSLVLADWEQSGEKRSEHVAEALLKEMSELHSSGHRNIKPNTPFFNYVIDAWISNDVKWALERAETVFEVMESGGAEMKPDSHTYSSLINANIIARKPHRAMDLLLEHMIAIYEGDCQKMKPNVDLFNTVLDACNKSCESDLGAKSLEVLLRMEVLYKNGNSDLQPNINSLNSVLNSLGKSHDAETAENLLKKYSTNKYATPNTASFNAVISAWVNKDSKDSALKAENLLKQMEYMYGNGVETVQPNISSYNMVLSAFARSKEASAIFLAKNVLDRMMLIGNDGNCSVLPTLQSFCSVLSACAHSSPEGERKEALSVAISTFKTLHSSEHVHQNSYIHAIFFKACANLMPRGPERNKILSNGFKLACKDEQVSNLVKSIMFVPRVCAEN